MKIIEKSSGLTDRQVFTITHGNNLVKLSDNDGRQFDVVEYILYSDADPKTGEERELLALVTNDGDILSTNSATVIRTFRDMLESFTIPLTDIVIESGTSKNGRTFYDIRFA